ncbi:DUF2339 domain-containing protein [Leminorella grimontii]|uniref:DUF2339 domain-containing protein n=1 Tax=Leminorella grimontii TaxID=82981 RepID=UPI00321FA023
MDGLVLLGLLIVLAILGAPIMALIALSRGRQALDEVSRLKKQVDALNKTLASLTAGDAATPKAAPRAVEQASESTASPSPAPVIETVETEAPPVLVSVLEPIAARVAKQDVVESVSTKASTSTETLAKPMAKAEPVVKPVPKVDVHSESGSPKPASARASGDVKPQAPDPFSSAIHWLFKENPVAKLGILLLFFGIAYLLKYTIERDMFPIELRLASAALVSVVLLGLGWRLRHKQALYALILQGGAIGALYITTFAAFRLYALVPHTFAFGLMLVICAASVALAVLQRALSLAMLASIGGYLAPVLLSTGGGSHVALFSYYLLISCGILAISLWQSWRALNLVGFAFTFGVAGLWGAEYYRPEYYVSCQLFLIANLVLFSLLAELFAMKHRLKQHMAVDAPLVFGPPLVGFAMQYAMTEHWAFGAAFSALGFGLLYLVVAWWTLKRFPEEGKRIAIGYLALGGGFVTLAIPLALSAQWTALAWSLEGVAILWCGLLQRQRGLTFSGTGLVALGLISQCTAYMDAPFGGISLLLGLAIVSLSLLVSAGLWRRYRPETMPWKPISLSMLAVGILVWCWWLFELSIYVYGYDYAYDYLFISMRPLAYLLGFSLSVLVWRWAGRRFDWPELRQAAWLLWPIAGIALALQLSYDPHPLAAGFWNLCWAAAIVVMGWLLKRDAPTLLPSMLEKGGHLTLFWLVLALVGCEAFWQIDGLAWGMDEWRFGLRVIALSLPTLALWWLSRRGLWPIKAFGEVYWLGVSPLALGMLVLLACGNFMDGQLPFWRYLPLFNPLEEAAWLGIVAAYIWMKALTSRMSEIAPLAGWSGKREQISQTASWIAGGLAVWWINGMLLRALSYYAQVAWWPDTLWGSRLIQATFAIIWTLVALVGMVYAARSASRPLWFSGAGVLGVVIVKLFLVDSAQGGGLARAIAFLGVAGLLLVVGYFSPLPPRQTAKREQTQTS